MRDDSRYAGVHERARRSRMDIVAHTRVERYNATFADEDSKGDEQGGAEKL